MDRKFTEEQLAAQIRNKEGILDATKKSYENAEEKQKPALMIKMRELKIEIEKLKETLSNLQDQKQPQAEES